MPRVCAQATPAIGTVPGDRFASPPGVSMRLIVLIGASASQPRGTQYWSNASKVVSSISVEPLRRRHVAVQAGNDQAGREPVLEGERLAVHRHGDQRVAPVERRDREAARVAVGRPTDDLVRRWVDAGLGEQVVEARAEPAGGADEAATDLVGHAGHGDVRLDQVTVEEVRVRELDLPVDHAGDAQRPGLRRHLRHGQRGVDAVEVGVGGEERADTVDARSSCPRRPASAARRVRADAPQRGSRRR